ncbi:phage tail tube protein [Tissierella sp. MSJ-40]|uniref:Phage tail tube protein n=1 Tax=Tissierella simiarum TaxID=2841534 RepID=A0ABS6EBQ3_9FIRM|nr:phage tail tube protein [Tissierella simiarum]MBU5440291.1 phage tail tube protein [Tissierella simiarum]
MSVELKSKDAISGKEGRAYMIVDGRRHLLFCAKKIKIDFEKQKTEIKTIGRRVTGHKAAGFSLKGEMTILQPEDIFTEMAIDYIRTGQDMYFELLIENDDPTSEAGSKQTIVRECNLDSATLAMLDAESDTLEQEVSFTCEDIDIIKKYKKLSYGN